MHLLLLRNIGKRFKKKDIHHYRRPFKSLKLLDRYSGQEGDRIDEETNSYVYQSNGLSKVKIGAGIKLASMGKNHLMEAENVPEILCQTNLRRAPTA